MVCGHHLMLDIPLTWCIVDVLPMATGTRDYRMSYFAWLIEYTEMAAVNMRLEAGAIR